MRQYIDTLQDVQGNALVGATVLVNSYLTGSAASIYSDNGLTLIANSTVTTDASGQFSFFAADGDYTLVMSKNSTVFKTQSPVTLFDGAAQLTYVDTGSANAYAVTNSALEKQLRTGLRASFMASNANTGASTFQYNGLAAKSIVFPAAIAVLSGIIAVGGIYALEYDGTNWQMRGGLSTAGYYPQTALEAAAGVTPSNYSVNSANYDPLRYGAVGDGATDDSTAMNSWASVLNQASTPIVSIWSGAKQFLCGPITAITPNDVTIQMNGGGLLAKAGTWNSNSIGLYLSGARCRIYSGNLNGNQSAFSVAVGGCMLAMGNDFQLINVKAYNCQGDGMHLTAVSQGTATACHFDSSAGTGLVLYNGCSYLRFSQCTFNYNGYGFQKTLATNTFNGFGLGVRFRSHHITFVDCQALQNGRDGMNVNQGSYCIKFSSSLCWMNGDGGFTVAADNTSVGTPGNSESPYTIEYVDCESYNNWSSGLAVYVPAYNIQVVGGRYYNNHRLAGSQTEATSYPNGIYVAAGSERVDITGKAQCYDDRQICAISAIGTVSTTVTLTATNWVAGTMGNYPTVAFYSTAVSGPGWTFQGYGTITAESSGSVTIKATSYNSVTLSSITTSWYVTQRTQHNGVTFDSSSSNSNAVQGTCDTVGYGQLPGPGGVLAGITGFKTFSSDLASGQNIRLPGGHLDSVELLANPSWDSSYTTGWTYTLGTGSAALYTTAGLLLRSPGCLQLSTTAGGSNVTGLSSLITSGLNYVTPGSWVEATVWVYAAGVNQAGIALVWSGTYNSTVVHPGGGWRALTVGAFLTSSQTSLAIEVIAVGQTGSNTVYFDEASLRIVRDPYDNLDYSPPPNRVLAV